jgi:hypothetical protein
MPNLKEDFSILPACRGWEKSSRILGRVRTRIYDKYQRTPKQTGKHNKKNSWNFLKY